MRSFAFESISPAEFDAFSAAHPQGNFQQTSRMGARRAGDGIDVEYLGVREDGALVAATQLEIHKGRMSTFAMIHDGPLCDLADTELTAFLFEGIRAHAKRAGAAELQVTPEMPYMIRDTHGAPLPAAGSNDPWPAGVPADAPRGANDAAVAALKGAGCEHAGFTLGYSDVPRWRYVKDLSSISNEQELTASYLKNTKRNVRIAHESGVYVERIGRDQLPLFHDICELSCEKQGFDNHSVEYFESLFDALGDDAEFTIAFIDTRAYRDSWVRKRDGFAADVERFKGLLENSPAPEKVEKKLRDVQGKYDAAVKRVEGAERYLAEAGERIPAAAALFVWHPRECVYLFSGSDPKYAKFYAATAIQHRMMLECLERGVKRYNFYGIDGVFDDPDDPGRGLLEFKQGFGGYVEELMGEFTLTVRPIARALNQLAHRALGH